MSDVLQEARRQTLNGELPFAIQLELYIDDRDVVAELEKHPEGPERATSSRSRPSRSACSRCGGRQRHSTGSSFSAKRRGCLIRFANSLTNIPAAPTSG